MYYFGEFFVGGFLSTNANSAFCALCDKPVILLKCLGKNDALTLSIVQKNDRIIYKILYLIKA